MDKFWSYTGRILVIIAILGIIGLYLGKTFDQTKQRPLYIVRRKT